MIDTKLRRTTGFTLVELMVVIGIMALLMAIIIPATQSLRRGNRISTCAFKLQQISNAMKAYHFDYGSVPPRYPGYDDTFDGTRDFDLGEAVEGPGLAALWEAGYLSNRRALHCPSDKEHSDPNEYDPAYDYYPYPYYLSYMDEDLDATALFGFDNYKYLSTRGLIAADPYFKRQLEDPLFYETLPVDRQNWYPDDRTVVTWCNFHTTEYFRDNEGQYQVLFWDGSTKTLPAIMFAVGEPGAIPVWQADPD